jgi:WD40 repeat protein
MTHLSPTKRLHDTSADLSINEEKYDAFLFFFSETNNNEIIFEINNMLKSQGIRTTTTWLDDEEQKMTSSHNNNDIPKNRIDKSRKIVVFITKELMNKLNDNNSYCKRMFEYAFNKNDNMKWIIPVVMEEDMRDQSNWIGILGNVLGNTLYYDLSPSVLEKMREKIVKALVEAIQQADNDDASGIMGKPTTTTTTQQASSSSSSLYVSTIFPPKSSHAPVEVLRGHSGQVRSVCYSPDSKFIVSGSWDNTVRIWEVESGNEIRKLEGHSDSVW